MRSRTEMPMSSPNTIMRAARINMARAEASMIPLRRRPIGGVAMSFAFSSLEAEVMVFVDGVHAGGGGVGSLGEDGTVKALEGWARVVRIRSGTFWCRFSNGVIPNEPSMVVMMYVLTKCK